MNFNPADYFVHTLAIVPGDEENCKDRVKVQAAELWNYIHLPHHTCSHPGQLSHTTTCDWNFFQFGLSFCD